MASSSPAAGVPAPLASAINKAAKKYDVPPDLLAGIWRVESGSKYPNPYVNSSGYGGLFGTTNGLSSTQDQANTAASVLAAGLKAGGGNIAQALSYYNSGKLSGGYTTVPGETSFGTYQFHTGGGGFVSGLEGAAGDVAAVGIGQAAFGPIGAAIAGADAIGGSTNSIARHIPGVAQVEDTAGAVVGAIEFLFSYRFLEIVGGALLVIVGLTLLGRTTGILSPSAVPSFNANAPTPTSDPPPATEGSTSRSVEPLDMKASRLAKESRNADIQLKAAQGYGDDIPY